MVDRMEQRTLTFQKNGHTFLFRYLAGQEQCIVDEIMDLAQSPRCPLDWIDAATISFQIVHHVVSGADAPLPNTPEH
jgi:hypothetical protein